MEDSFNCNVEERSRVGSWSSVIVFPRNWNVSGGDMSSVGSDESSDGREGNDAN